MEHWSGEAREALRQGSAEAADASTATAGAASNRLDETWQQTGHLAAQSTQRLVRTAPDLQGGARDSALGDRLLFGVAGAAVAAALGIALRRRIAETEPAD